MGHINSTKNAIRPINSSKNKLNNKKNWFFKSMPNSTFNIFSAKKFQ